MDVDAFIDSTNRLIVSAARASSASEPVWDGFGGLVLIGESVVFREEGLFSAYSPLPPSSSGDLSRTKTALAASTSQSVITTENAQNVEEKRLSTPKAFYLSNSVESETVEIRPSEKLEISHSETVKSNGHHPPTQNMKMNTEDEARPERVKESIVQSAFLSTKTSPVVQSPKEMPPVVRFDHFSDSDAERFKSRLMAVRSEGLPAKETMLKCAGIADDAFRLAVKKLQLGEFAEAFLLAEVAESACPASITSAKTKILSLKQSARRRLKKSVVVQS